MKNSIAHLDSSDMARGAGNGGEDGIKIAVLSRNRETLKELSDYFSDQEPAIRLQIWPGDANHLAVMVEQERPTMLLLEEPGARDIELEALEAVIRNHPALAVVVLCAQPSREFLLQALRIGVSEVMPLPLTRQALESGLGRLRQRVLANSSAGRRGMVIAFLPCKGGAGATFIAANLAHAIAAQGKRVCLIDLNLHLGVAALYVSDRAPPANVADVAAQIQRLDAALLESSMLHVAPHFWLLAAPDSPERAMDIRAENVERILNVARGSYDFVVLDVSRALDANSIKALDCSDQIYLVMQQGLPFIRDGNRLLGLFRSLAYPDARVQLLVNRYEKAADISLRDIEQALGMQVAKTMPNSFSAVAISINQGKPVLDLAPRDPIARSLREMACELARTEPEQPEAGGWLRRFKRQA